HPFSPPVPQWPWNFSGPNPPTLLRRILPQGGVMDSPQAIGLNWLATSISESGFVPPDSNGAVGPTQVMVFINGRIKAFDKTTGAVTALNSSDTVFFAPVSAGLGLSDPNIRYDPTSQRWFATTVTTNTPNRVLIARSSGPTISGSSSFTFF